MGDVGNVGVALMFYCPFPSVSHQDASINRLHYPTVCTLGSPAAALEQSHLPGTPSPAQPGPAQPLSIKTTGKSDFGVCDSEPECGEGAHPGLALLSITVRNI